MSMYSSCQFYMKKKVITNYHCLSFFFIVRTLYLFRRIYYSDEY